MDCMAALLGVVACMCVGQHPEYGKGEKGHRIQKGSWRLLGADLPAIRLLVPQRACPEGAENG